ncbi:MAG: hypothetical protein FD149_2544 [Rhodospirillaceae bacterium]|nr:MAG: hypothetical protein FD149_2544 [Rhodospirillaceae bacterium]
MTNCLGASVTDGLCCVKRHLGLKSRMQRAGVVQEGQYGKARPINPCDGRGADRSAPFRDREFFP